MHDTKRKYVEQEDGTLKLNYGPKMKKSTYQKLRKYRDNYVKENYRQFNIKIQKTDNADVIKFMEEQENLAGYIADLVRTDLHKMLRKEYNGQGYSQDEITEMLLKEIPVKKKPGRPPKKKPEAESVSADSDAVPVKRGRGRPRKVVVEQGVKADSEPKKKKSRTSTK